MEAAALQRQRRHLADGGSSSTSNRCASTGQPYRPPRCTADLLPVTSVPMQVAVLNGVNFNMLGRRPEQYGTLTLSQLETKISAPEWALELNMTVRQAWHTNSEGA